MIRQSVVMVVRIVHHPGGWDQYSLCCLVFTCVHSQVPNFWKQKLWSRYLMFPVATFQSWALPWIQTGMSYLDLIRLPSLWELIRLLVDNAECEYAVVFKIVEHEVGNWPHLEMRLDRVFDMSLLQTVIFFFVSGGYFPNMSGISHYLPSTETISEIVSTFLWMSRSTSEKRVVLWLRWPSSFCILQRLSILFQCAVRYGRFLVWFNGWTRSISSHCGADFWLGVLGITSRLARINGFFFYHAWRSALRKWYVAEHCSLKLTPFSSDRTLVLIMLSFREVHKDPRSTSFLRSMSTV